MAPAFVPLPPWNKTGSNINQLGLGLMGLSHENGSYGTVPDDETRFAFLDHAHAMGCRNWDTSDLYGDGEELLGKWFERSGKRDDIFLASKFGFVKGKGFEVDSSGAYCKAACDESLRLLGTKTIDLYYMHHANKATPIEETMRALVELQNAGKIKHIGLSAIDSATLERAVKIAPVAAVQVDYSPFFLAIEGAEGTHLLSTCRKLGVAVFCAMPLGRGLLTSNFASGERPGDAKDIREKHIPRFMEEHRAKNVEVVAQFRTLADKIGCSVTQLALAWLMKQGNDIIPIPGTKRIKYLDENWAAQDVHLTDENEAEIRRFVEGAELSGDTVPPMFKHMLFSSTVEEA